MTDATPSKTTLGDLPEWDLSDLYSGVDAPELETDLTQSADKAAAFAERYKGNLASLGGAALAGAIREYEAMDEVLSAVMSFSGLLHAGAVSDPEVGKFYQTIQERVNNIFTPLLFFTLELNRIGEDDIAAKLTDPTLAHYGPWLRDIRAMRPHQLSDEIETLLHEKSVAGRSAWMRLFDETMADLRFPYRNRKLTTTEILDLLSDNDGAARKEAAKSVGIVLGENVRLFSLITNTLAKDKEIDDKWRKFERPVSSRNLSNLVEDDVVDALVNAVKDSYPRLAHRYYKLKASWFGAETLDYWDRNAPLPDEDERIISWNDARDTVLGAYARFSGELADVGQRFFDNAWIDAPARAGKASGAFAHPTVPSAHPYLLLNYQGKTRDVMTLAHELGHGVHQVLAGGQGHLMSDTPLTLAETASVFGEMLTFQAMLDATTNAKERRVMLAGKVEDMLNTVVRQIAFYEFEKRVHDERRTGELTGERLGEIWLDIQGESLGPAIRFHDEYRTFWAYIPHFIHSPFYVYSYAFGDCLVNSLYSQYENGDDEFAEKYLDMLRAGGVKRHKELLAPFGLDASDPAFWAQGLAVVESFLDQLEATS